METDQDVYNFLKSPEINMIAVFVSAQIFVWVYLMWWGLWELLVHLEDPNLNLLNKPWYQSLMIYMINYQVKF